MFKGRNLVNAIGIPGWLLLIWVGGAYYSAFILITMLIAMGEFYAMAEKKGAKPILGVGLISSVLILSLIHISEHTRPY